MPPPTAARSHTHRRSTVRAAPTGPTLGQPPPARAVYPPCRSLQGLCMAGPTAFWGFIGWAAGLARPLLPLLAPARWPPPAVWRLRPVLAALRVVRLGVVSASRFQRFCQVLLVVWGCVLVIFAWFTAFYAVFCMVFRAFPPCSCPCISFPLFLLLASLALALVVRLAPLPPLSCPLLVAPFWWAAPPA